MRVFSFLSQKGVKNHITYYVILKKGSFFHQKTKTILHLTQLDIFSIIVKSITYNSGSYGLNKTLLFHFSTSIAGIFLSATSLLKAGISVLENLIIEF